MPLGYAVSHWGRVIKLALWEWKAPQTISNDFSLGTLPEWARPKSAVSVPAPSDSPRAWLVVERGGQARLQMESGGIISAGTTLFWTFTYLA